MNKYAKATYLILVAIFSTLTILLPACSPSPTFNSTPTISPGDNHTLILNSNGQVYSVGWNWYGQLGNGGALSQHNVIQIEGLNQAIDIAAGGFHSLALRYGGTVWAWGNNQSGQLGLGDSTNRNIPTQIPNLTDIVAISAGNLHSLALDNNGNLWAWGNNSAGQLGSGDTEDRITPTKIENLENIAKIAAGHSHSFAIDKGQNLYGWGRNETGQITRDDLDNQLVPIQIESNITSVAAGNEHTIANSSNPMRLFIWGVNWSGQLGAENAEFIQNRLAHAEFIAAGEGHSLILRSNNNGDEENQNPYVFAFGWNESGQHYEDVYAPTRIENLENIQFIAAGPESSFAIDSRGYIWVWGANTFGQLGLGNTESSPSPVRMRGVGGRGYLRVR